MRNLRPIEFQRKQSPDAKKDSKSNGNSTMKGVKDWVSSDIRNLKAYTVPSSTGMIKLDAMENPYTLPDELKINWLEKISESSVNRYPDPNCNTLKDSIRKCFGISDDCGLILGNGSDELIQIIAMLVGGYDRTIIAPWPSFSMYQQICISTSTQFVGVPLNSDFSLDLDNLIKVIDKHNPACIFLAYPNNPTGNCFDCSEILKVLECTPGLVVVDEAYFAFSQKTFLADLKNYPNLIILRTMSKSGLAGLRLGMLVGNVPWVEQLEKLRLPYNINCLTQSSAKFYIYHHRVLEQQAAQIVRNRQVLVGNLEKISGIEIFPSETNFLLVRAAKGAGNIYQGLCDNGILVKNLHNQAPVLESCLRVTVGTQQENEKFIEVLSTL